MIVFDLICKQGHVFEGWFDSAAEFDRQKEGKLVACPMCDAIDVERRPSAKVKVAKAARAAAAVPATAPATAAKPSAAQEAMAGLPPDLLAKLREIVRSTEDVGERFPEEARKIHYEEVPHRAIRGEATADEARELADEGIDFAPIPPILSRDEH